jgi:hypothetical protein
MSGNSSCHVVTSGLVRQSRGAASRGPPVGVLACNAVEGQGDPSRSSVMGLGWGYSGVSAVARSGRRTGLAMLGSTRVAASRGPTEHSL